MLIASLAHKLDMKVHRLTDGLIRQQGSTSKCTFANGIPVQVQMLFCRML